MTEHSLDDSGGGAGAPFPPVDPPGAKADPVKDAVAAQEAAGEVERGSGSEAPETDWKSAVGTARAALTEIHALSSSPSVNTERLGNIAKKALDALPVT